MKTDLALFHENFSTRLLAFILIILGFIWVTNNQLEDYNQKLSPPVPVAKINDKASYQLNKGKNFVIQNNEIQQRLNPGGEFINLSWEILSKVHYFDSYDQEQGHYRGAMTFDPMVKVVHGREVIIQGYLVKIPDAEQAPFYILSAYPAGESFLSGSYGSETAMDLYFEVREIQDLEEKEITVSGVFNLSDQDFAGLYYSIKAANILEGN